MLEMLCSHGCVTLSFFDEYRRDRDIVQVGGASVFGLVAIWEESSTDVCSLPMPQANETSYPTPDPCPTMRTGWAEVESCVWFKREEGGISMIR